VLPHPAATADATVRPRLPVQSLLAWEHEARRVIRHVRDFHSVEDYDVLAPAANEDE
jgi:hypothetical protein